MKEHDGVLANHGPHKNARKGTFLLTRDICRSLSAASHFRESLESLVAEWNVIGFGRHYEGEYCAGGLWSIIALSLPQYYRPWQNPHPHVRTHLSYDSKRSRDQVSQALALPLLSMAGEKPATYLDTIHAESILSQC